MRAHIMFRHATARGGFTDTVESALEAAREKNTLLHQTFFLLYEKVVD